MNSELARLGEGLQGILHARAAKRCSLLLATALVAQACSEGSGGSKVGESTAVAPTARAQILNAGTNNNTFREGSEVFLTGKASEDLDGPLLFWYWEQTGGPAVTLVERNSTTVSFTAPDVDASTTLTFELTVEDTTGGTAADSVAVSVVPGQDGDEFLSLDLVGAPKRHDRFKVVAALADGASTGPFPEPFTLAVNAYLVYPPRSNDGADCGVLPLSFVPGSQTQGGCRVELLANVTPANGLSGEWPANVGPVSLPASPTANDVRAMWWNPQFELVVPRLDAADFNQRFLNQALQRRDLMLDPFNVHRARIVLTAALTAPTKQADASLILADVGDTPIEVPAESYATVINSPPTGLPTEAVIDVGDLFAAVDGRESALTSEVYYKTVDPEVGNTGRGRRETLNAWLQHAGFAADANGTLIAAAEDGTGEFAHAVYLNNYDLGFGRDMYARLDQFGNVYSFVTNYATLEGAIRKLDSIVTVVMEYSPLDADNPSDPDKFVKFFTYVDNGAGDQERVSSMNFDGRGERFTPGNCIICHGGLKPPSIEQLDFDAACADRQSAACYTWPTINESRQSIANGNLSATFLPWDVDSLLFADNDPAIVDAPVPFDGLTLSRELERDFGNFAKNAQLAQIKKLNQAAYATYCDDVADPNCPSAGAKALVRRWYGGVDSNGQLIGNYSDATPIDGWLEGASFQPDPLLPAEVNPASAETLYRDVFAQHCRMCHTNISDPSLRFDHYQKLRALAGTSLTDMIYRKGLMPAARLTADRFWVSFDGGTPAAEHLANEFGIQPVDGRLDPRPRAVISGAPSAVLRHDPLRLSARDSSFASSFDWNVTFDPDPDLLGNPAVANYVPRLVGDSTSSLAFEAEMPGTYTVDLGINGAGGPTATLPALTVLNQTPVACADNAGTMPGGPNRQIAFLGNDGFRDELARQSCAGMNLVALRNGRDLPRQPAPLYSFVGVTFNQSGQYTTPNGGTFTLAPNSPCALNSNLSAATGCDDDTLTYQPPSSAADTFDDTLQYVVTDVDGNASMGMIRVTVTRQLQAFPTVANPVVVSDLTAALTFTISGGAIPTTPGQLRYTVTQNVSNPPNLGVISGLTFPFMTDNANVSFNYTSNDFATGTESFAFNVSDGSTTTTVTFNFSVLPQAPFSGSAAAPGQLGRVVDQFGSCGNCHFNGGTGGAYWRADVTVAQLHTQFVSGTLNGTALTGGAKVVPSAQRQTNPDASKILCYPATATNVPGSCGNLLHSAADQVLSTTPRNIIRRWIQENALQN